MSGMFVIKDDETQTLVEMNEQAYDSEDFLQTLLEKYRNLLAGDQINSDEPREWLLVTREAALPGEEGGAARWSVDHLFLDQDGIPTLVEVKRSTDTRIRREVVGQMLDYAANAVVYWPADEVRAKFRIRCAAHNVDPDQRLVEFLGDRGEPEEFWTKVRTHLEAGKIRMVFVADVIPPELQRVVEFLNTQMNPAEVFAVQIKQYTGEGLRTLVPRVVGITSAATDRKQGLRPSRQWDEQSFLEDVRQKSSGEMVAVAKRILAWALDRQVRIWWGKGAQEASFVVCVDGPGQSWYVLRMSSGYTTPYLSFQFRDLKNQPPFDDLAIRTQLLSQINSLPGVRLPPEAIDKYPSLKPALLSDPVTMERFLAILDWVVSTVGRPGEQDP